MTDNASKWFYAKKGNQVGPISLLEIKSLVDNGTINAETSVWNGEGDWKSAKNTELSDLFIKPSSTPPPLSGSDVNNLYVWLVVAVPILGIIIQQYTGVVLMWIYLALNIVFCILDERKLKSAGHVAPNTVWAFFIPVYLWKRANFLKQKKLYLWCWIIALSLSIVLTYGLNKNAYGDALVETACPLVTQIIQEQLGGSAVCKAVTIDREISDGFYKATAYLDNGNELQITIEEREGNQIYVQIPYQ